MKVSDYELAINQIPISKRDFCAHLLIDFNRCRRREDKSDCHQIIHKYEACKIYEYIICKYLFLV